MESKTIGAYTFRSDGTIWMGDRRHGGMKPNSDGYLLVCLNGKQVKVHRAIAQAFIPNPDNLPQVNHINGIKTDNRVENLEWCTQADNMRHGMRMGLIPPVRGSMNGLSILTEDDVCDIKRNLRDNNHRGIQTRMAEKYKVTIQCINLIKRGKNWSHLKIDGSV